MTVRHGRTLVESNAHSHDPTPLLLASLPALHLLSSDAAARETPLFPNYVMRPRIVSNVARTITVCATPQPVLWVLPIIPTTARLTHPPASDILTGRERPPDGLFPGRRLSMDHLPRWGCGPASMG